MKALRILFWIGACIMISAYGCSGEQHDHPDGTTGEQLYNLHCAECHREDGTGILFDSLPANILTQKSPEEIVRYITTDSNHQRLMPAFKTMPSEEAELITQHLMKLKLDYEKGMKNKPKQLLIEP
ncbi:cytochrome c [Candidatus Nitronereus thalassa]|uniref:Cytochrome c n=1 Tax=Candidatus Nitronereus thalassa TaxID=3020898 RepID=A0ABU3K911_9BACT|nr:cytochrome c [Candidatus Nitronereus thalassa]MDT7042778.1 cytochrome c [Candidatus Nitronereus thalassa]